MNDADYLNVLFWGYAKLTVNDSYRVQQSGLGHMQLILVAFVWNRTY